MKPQIIILLSTWNGEKYLRQQLDSLLSQTVIDRMQILVRDDGSSDETVAILKEYEKTGKLTFYQGKNLGSTQSFFQLLIDAPKADYYAFCDQDDYWLKEKVGKAVQGIEKIQEPALYCSRKIIVDQDLHELPRSDVDPSMSVLDNFIRNNKASGCTMVINHKLREIFLRYRPQMVPFHDSWIYKLALFFGKVVYSRESYIKYRQHGNNVTGAEAHGIQLFFKIDGHREEVHALTGLFAHGGGAQDLGLPVTDQAGAGRKLRHFARFNHQWSARKGGLELSEFFEHSFFLLYSICFFTSNCPFGRP